MVIGAVSVDLEHVPDSETERFDARVVADVDLSAEVVIVGRLRIEETTPIEIKTCQIWLDDASANGGRRRGRWYIQRPAHDNLCDLGGAYLLVVLDDDEVLAYALVTSTVLDLELGGRWTPSGADSYRDEVAQLPWGVVFDDVDVDPEVRHG